MCGITGIFNLDGSSVDINLLSKMTRSLAHRGPDDEGIWIDRFVGLGHRRLAIRDLSPSGHQPMTDVDGRVVVTYNGEIYNDAELRRELGQDFGFRFTTACDTEIIPAGYLAWGNRLFERIEGMFAIALYDRDEQKLILARDAAGVKPLYVSHSPNSIRFASEIKAFLEDPFHTRNVDAEGLLQFMAQGYPSPGKSLLKDVSQMPPGVVRTYHRKGVQERTFWRPKRTGEIKNMDEALEGFEKLFTSVIDQMLTSDVPLGSLQSSGVDSSLISLSLKQTKYRPTLFTARFDESSYDESDVARVIADFGGFRHQTVAIGEALDAEKIFRAVVRHVDGQLADSSAYPAYLLFKGIRPFVTVALSGDGADEFFGGYPTYRASKLASWLQPCIPPFTARFLGNRAFGLNGKGEGRLPLWEVVARFFWGLSAPGNGGCHAYWRRLMPEYLERRVLGPELLRIRENLHPLSDYISQVADEKGTLVDRCLLADQRHYLPSDMLLKVDSMSMAHGVEVRLPFVDRRVMDFAGRLDSSLLTSFCGPDKKILRSALSKYNISFKVASQSKRGFNTPLAKLLRTKLFSLSHHYLDTEVERLAPYFNPDGVRTIWRTHAEGKENHGYFLWCLLTFAVWHETIAVEI